MVHASVSIHQSGASESLSAGDKVRGVAGWICNLLRNPPQKKHQPAGEINLDRG